MKRKAIKRNGGAFPRWAVFTIWMIIWSIWSTKLYWWSLSISRIRSFADRNTWISCWIKSVNLARVSWS